jgi:hypothetical protein
MPANADLSTGARAGVRKPPKNETAVEAKVFRLFLCSAGGGLWPILLQKSGGSVGPTFSGPCRCSSKKYVGVHSNDRSRHERLPQPRYNAFEQCFLVAAAFAWIFGIFNFSTFATESAHCRPGRVTRHVRSWPKLTQHPQSIRWSTHPNLLSSPRTALGRGWCRPDRQLYHVADVHSIRSAYCRTRRVNFPPFHQDALWLRYNECPLAPAGSTLSGLFRSLKSSTAGFAAKGFAPI